MYNNFLFRIFCSISIKYASYCGLSLNVKGAKWYHNRWHHGYRTKAIALLWICQRIILISVILKTDSKKLLQSVLTPLLMKLIALGLVDPGSSNHGLFWKSNIQFYQLVYNLTEITILRWQKQMVPEILQKQFMLTAKAKSCEQQKNI